MLCIPRTGGYVFVTNMGGAVEVEEKEEQD
jgi:hypothetical protein